MKLRSVALIFLLTVFFEHTKSAFNTYTLDGSDVSFADPFFVSFDHGRAKRAVEPSPSNPVPVDPAVPVTAVPGDAASASTSTTVSEPTSIPAKAGPASPAPADSAVPDAQPPLNQSQTLPANGKATNLADDSNRTVNGTSNSTAAPAQVTQVPLLGVNGSGILHDHTTNLPKVSEPLFPDDNMNMTDVFNETPENIKAENNITNLKYDNHNFYNSTFIGNLTYFNEYWANLTEHKGPTVHEVLSNSHRRATTMTLSFNFPFYGHELRNVTIATGGFVYTGDHVHNWLAATQYIAPLMANFDTTLTNDSYVKLLDDGEKFTAFWENVTLQEDHTKKFTFAVTLYANGDIIFAYKDIPIAVQDINDKDHPVKVGISDAYLTDRILFLVRRKTIYEYHRVSFKNHEIASGTILKLTALSTCLQYTDCESCVNHETEFDCMWCEALHKCSSGTDRNKQDWHLRSCDRSPISNVSSCPVRKDTHAGAHAEGGTAYITDAQNVYHQATVNNLPPSSENPPPPMSAGSEQRPNEARSPVGGVIVAFVAITLVSGAAAWALYAFKNPHTRSGQLLIKYRPSQWSWRRGEARYTAATIHM